MHACLCLSPRPLLSLGGALLVVLLLLLLLLDLAAACFLPGCFLCPCSRQDCGKGASRGWCSAYCDGYSPNAYGSLQVCEYATSGASCCGSCDLRCWSEGCSIACRVDCQLALGAVPPCNPTCLEPTIVVKQQYYTARYPANGGSRCAALPDPILHTCTTDCVKDCAMDLRPTQCSDCNASCKDSVKPIANGVSVCTYSKTQEALWGGKPCGPATSTHTCSKTCDVDCVQQLVPKPTCTADCVTLTVTMTQPWTTAVTPYNAGKQCDPKKSFETSVCSTKCTTDCTLDPDQKMATCNLCTGNCRGPFPTLEPGSQVCRSATLTPAGPGGIPCPNPTYTRACTETCCAMRAPLRDEYTCPANCLTLTSTITMLYTPLNVVENAARRCPVDRVSALEVCTLDPYEAKRCGGICVVDGVPDNPCPAKCLEFGANPPAGPFVATANYPVTLHYGDLNCPFERFICNCAEKTCRLSPQPTDISPCDASCAAFDDRYALGIRTLFYGILDNPVGAVCLPNRIVTCAKYCACQGAVQTLAPCQYTTTQATAIPWMKIGIQKATMIAAAPVCNKQFYITCAEPIPPQNCLGKYNCDSGLNNECSCTSRNGPDYEVTGSLTCSFSVIRTPQGGGVACPTEVAKYYPCTRILAEQKNAKLCPGCSYLTPPVTHCIPTEIVGVADGSLEIRGTVELAYPLVKRGLQDYGNENGPAWQPPAPLCTSSIEKFDGMRCTTTIGPNDCHRLYDSCGPCVETRLVQLGLNFMRYGTRTCILTDPRGGIAPRQCKTASEKIDQCSETPTKTNCQVAKYCQPCQTTCSAIQTVPEVLTGRRTCYYKTVTKAAFGGSSCNPVPLNGEEENCYKICDVTATENGLPLWVTDELFSVYVAENAIGYLSSLGGRTVVCGNAVFGSVAIGNDASAHVSDCDVQGPMLYVGGNLMMLGSVVTAPAKIFGRCSGSNVNAPCGITCDSIRDDCDKSGAEHPDHLCPAMQANVVARSNALAVLKATAALIPVAQRTDLYNVKWGGTPINTALTREVINIPASMSASFPTFGAYSILPGEVVTEIVINVFGSKVSMKGISLRYFEEFRKITWWNFPEATTLELTGMTIPGTVVAPKAVVTGNALIRGRLYAKSLEGTIANSIQVQAL